MKRVSEYLASIISYYETGKYDKFKAYFITEYRETVDIILAVESAKEQEQNRLLRKT